MSGKYRLNEEELKSNPKCNQHVDDLIKDLQAHIKSSLELTKRKAIQSKNLTQTKTSFNVDVQENWEEIRPVAYHYFQKRGKIR